MTIMTVLTAKTYLESHHEKKRFWRVVTRDNFIRTICIHLGWEHTWQWLWLWSARLGMSAQSVCKMPGQDKNCFLFSLFSKNVFMTRIFISYVVVVVEIIASLRRGVVIWEPWLMRRKTEITFPPIVQTQTWLSQYSVLIPERLYLVANQNNQ